MSLDNIMTINNRNGINAFPTDIFSHVHNMKLIEDINFVREANFNEGSPFYFQGGFLAWLEGFKSLDELRLYLTDIFNTESIIETIMQLMTVYSVYLSRKAMKKQEKHERQLDSRTENKIFETLLSDVNRKDAIKYFQKIAILEGQSTPYGLIMNAVANHLMGYPRIATNLFKKFKKEYIVKNSSTDALITHRHAKALSAEGEFNKANKLYSEIFEKYDLPALLRVQAAREWCNVVTQIAWDKPKEFKRWKNVEIAVQKFKNSLGGVYALKRKKIEGKIISFLTHSLKEFELISNSKLSINNSDLKKVSKAIDSQIEFNYITGRNRNTQLAAMYLRIGEAKSALKLAKRFQGKIKDDVELALTYLIEAQCYIELNNKKEACYSIKRCVDHLDYSRTIRFRRIVSIFDNSLNKKGNNLIKIANSFFWPFRGPTRHVGAFVPQLPKLSL